ncbi:MAG TPA: amidohydrolase [Candidatus Acidoferrum sp.]|jgi:predicted amidohydrolase YtcJ|nr:amidohydrolase [Candidatus Acidoferrum sp.]
MKIAFSIRQAAGCFTRCFLTLFFFVSSLSAQSPSADLVLLNAHVVTMYDKQPSAEAIAIEGDRIAWVGSTNEVKRLYPKPARTVDLHGRTVLPGIIDAHTHLINLGESLVRLNLKDLPTEKGIIERVKQRVASTAPGEWILGWGWDEGKWASNYPTNQALSAATPSNPVFLVGLHTFAAWANQRALQMAGITKNTKDPENGRIVRDETTGEPTGILLNRAQDLVAKHIPPATLAQAKRAMQLAARECVRNGLTSVHEAKVTPLMVQAVQEMVREGQMPLRVYAMLDGADTNLVDEWLKRGPAIDPHHQLTIRAFKLFADGALGSRGAALLEPYSDAPTKGVMTTPESEVHSLTRRALESGFQVCAHAIGDAANRAVLNAYEQAEKEVPEAHDPRLRIEHAQVLAPEDIPRFAKLGVIASMQPTHCTSDMPWAEKRLGPERVKYAYAWRSVKDSGAHLPLSSDFPGETLNPFYGIYAAITRQDPEGNPPDGWHAEQKLTLEQALRGYTIEAAYAEFEEKDKGSIEKGKLADLTVISEDIAKIPPRQILSIRVLKTFVGGKAVYDAEAVH